MKTFKQFSTILLLTLFIMVTNNSYAQKKEDLVNTKEETNSNFFLKADFILSNKSSGVDELQPFASHSFYYGEIDAIITITLDHTGKKIASINDPSNTFSDELLTNIIYNSNNDSAAASNCGCQWWNVLCKAYCALCKGLGGSDADCWFAQEE